jgi:hypothetical protein
MMSRLLLLRYVFVKRVEILISGRGLPLNIFPGDKDVFSCNLQRCFCLSDLTNE